jgi:hypothetical protein
MPDAASDSNPESAALPRDLNRLSVGDHPSRAGPAPSRLVGYLLARQHNPAYWAAVEELARRVDQVKGMPLGSTLAALIKKLHLPTEQ